MIPKTLSPLLIRVTFTKPKKTTVHARAYTLSDDGVEFANDAVGTNPHGAASRAIDNLLHDLFMHVSGKKK